MLIPPEEYRAECPQCSGDGWYVVDAEPDPNDPTGQTSMQVQVECEYCMAEGYIDVRLPY